MKLFSNMSITTRRRFKSFFKQRRAQVGLVMLIILVVAAMFAELWSQSVPILMIRDTFSVSSEGATPQKTGRRIYFPILVNYSVQEFGVTDTFVMDYSALVESDKKAGLNTIAIFPINRWDPYQQTPNVVQQPTKEHWLGTDNLGRDVFARLLYGLRVSLTFGFLYWFFSYLFGVAVGAIQGFFGGNIDFATERIKELGEIIPFLPTVIIVNGLMKSQSLWVTLGVVLIFAWIGISSQIRAQFLALRKREFVEAARALGSGRSRIIFIHLLPNAITPVLTLTPFAITGGISILAALDYLGYGLNPPTPSIGELLAQGRAYISNAPWLIESATAVLCMLLISINLIGEALRQAFDPGSN